MTNQTRNACWKNSNIAGEWGRLGRLANNTQYERDVAEQEWIDAGRPRKKAGDVTRALRAAEKRYENRSNVCPTCHMLVPVGTKVCDNCE